MRMRRLKALFFVSLLTGCSSAKYERMKSMEEYLGEGEPPRNGMAITKKGAVLDVTVEEVQAQKKRLQEELFLAERKIRALKEENASLIQKNRELRIVAGLSPEEGKPTITGYGERGEAIVTKPLESHEEEVLRIRRAPPSNPHRNPASQE